MLNQRGLLESLKENILANVSCVVVVVVVVVVVIVVVVVVVIKGTFAKDSKIIYKI